MKRLLVLVILSTSIVTTLHAQIASQFVGTWKVLWQGNTRELEAELILNDKGGSWKTYATTRNDPCIGREVPVAIESSTPDQLVLKLKFSEAVNGCPDASVTLRRAENGITGTRGKAALTLTKK